jgi:hypothetical protein
MRSSHRTPSPLPSSIHSFLRSSRVSHSHSSSLSASINHIQQIPWALRDLIADERVARFFANDFANLRNAFPDWHPKTAILRDIKRKLQPIQRLNTDPSTRSSPSKL